VSSSEQRRDRFIAGFVVISGVAMAALIVFLT
jgi:hypothetical protein